MVGGESEGGGWGMLPVTNVLQGPELKEHVKQELKELLSQRRGFQWVPAWDQEPQEEGRDDFIKYWEEGSPG